MVSDEIKKNRIMEFALKSFMASGVSHVTMDDIARGVGMGKGTVYKYFSSKEELLSGTVDYYAAQIKETIEGVLSNKSVTQMEKLVLFLKAIAEKVSVINPELLSYMERNMPEVFDKIETTRQRMIRTYFTQLFKEGKEKGLFDPGIDEILLAHMVIGTIRHLMDPKIFRSLDYSSENLFKAIMSVLLKGCLTEEGRKQLIIS